MLNDHRVSLAVERLHRVQEFERGGSQPLHLFPPLPWQDEGLHCHQPGSLADWAVAELDSLRHQAAGALVGELDFFLACLEGDMVDPGKLRRPACMGGRAIQRIRHNRIVSVSNQVCKLPQRMPLPNRIQRGMQIQIEKNNR